MEFPNKENDTGTIVITDEENDNSSIGTENVDDGVISERIEPSAASNDILSEIDPTNAEHASIGECEVYVEPNSDNNEIKSEEISDETQDKIEELTKNASSEITQTEIASEVTKVTEKYEEYVSVSQNEEGNQSTEYASEYVLEAQTENVYISEVQDVNLDSSGEVLSKESVSDDIQANDTPDQIDQHNIIMSDKLNENEINETNLISEHITGDHLGAENWSHPDDLNDELNTRSANNENASCNTDGTNEIQIQNESENNGNEKSIQEHITEVLEDGSVSEIVEENTEDGEDAQDVKEEIGEMEGNENFVTNKEPTDNVSESIESEQATDVVEHDLTNLTAVSSENMPVEGFTIAEGMEMTEIQEGEYTIVEGPSTLDISTNQVDESTTSDETWVLLENHEHSDDSQIETVVEEPNEVCMSETRNEAESHQSVSTQPSETKPRRGRKPTHEIPMHVLGHDISKPVESLPNGRALPKPRLGVKVPYRNLASQIVSKAEIEKEVMNRARMKQEQADTRGDFFFARQLTQRLARKIAPSPDPKRNTKKSNTTRIQRKETNPLPVETTEPANNESQDSSKIHNDSDLLAILEGEGDEMPVLPKEVPQPQVDDSNIKMLEREIALQQLQELPHQAPKHKIYRGRLIKIDGKAPVLTPEALPSSKTKTDSGVRESPSQRSKVDQPINDKENESTRRSTLAPSVSSKADPITIETPSSPKKHPIEIEPQVKVNMVLKTYSRKRKTVDLPETLAGSPLPKKPIIAEDEIKAEKTDTVTPTNVYVTKSSRIIKRKVIWDPDEAPTRSPKSVTKSDFQSPKIITVKTTKPAEKTSNSEKVPEKKPVTEKVIKEKPVEKKSSEKILTKKSAVSPTDKKVVLKSDFSKNKSPIKIKKIRSEVDKLLMDEGAVKMLYDLKNNDELVPKKKKDVYSVEKAHKEIMKKANEIKSDLQQKTSNESPKSLRKKETFAPSSVKPAQITYSTERKMSKDSTRSSVHTPPGSPAYSFPHSQSSMLVRRRSSSSISSSDEVDENDAAKSARKKSGTASEVPKSKKFKKAESNDEEPEKLTEVKEPPEKSVPTENKYCYESFTVKKSSKHVTINLNYVDEKCCCTVEVLEELTTALRKFAKDKDCNVVCVTSSSKAFCLGLDYTTLISDEEDVRKEKAAQLAEKVREFLLCLLKFPKVLVAGIQSECVGLGVTMLPLFDIVIASDTANFSTTYASLGCVAEAGFLLSPPIFTNHGLAAELLYSTHKITADDAFRRGLVTRLCWPEKYNETLKNLVVSISRGSKQSLLATKKQLRRHLVQTTEDAINSECTMWVEHWISPECQRNFTQLEEAVE